MPPRKHVAPELIAEGKYLYEETLTPTDEIGKRMGLSRSAFYLRVKEWNWQRRRYSSTLDEDAAKPVTPAAGAASALEIDAESGGARVDVVQQVIPDPRVALYARVWRAAQMQMDTIELVQKTLQPTHAAQSERTARIIATLNKTLIEIAAMSKPDEATPPHAADDDPIPRDIDEFRNELARRINALIDAGGDDESEETSEAPAALG